MPLNNPPVAAASGAPTDYPYVGLGASADLSAEVNMLTTYPINELQGWPPYVPDGTSLVGLWFASIGTPTTAPTVTHTAGEGGITETFERCIKCVTDANAEGFQTLAWTYVDQPRIKVGKALSAYCYIWCVGGLGVTASLVSSDASHTDAAKVTAAAWTAVEIPNHTTAGTSCYLKFIADGAGTFYVAMPSANIGARGMPLSPRPTRYVDKLTTNVLNNVDPGGADFTDLDFTASTSPLAYAVQVYVLYLNTTSLGQGFQIRRNGATDAGGNEIVRNVVITAGCRHGGRGMVALDDAQIAEYKTTPTASDVESIYLYVIGWWEWA